MGDAQKLRIDDYLGEINNTYDFIKMPHHGDYYKNLEDLFNKTNPSIAVITSSDEEKEEDKTIKLLETNNIDYYLTRKGDIDIYSDGESIYVDN